jgi:5-methylcytosine-specific restriction protein A
MTITKTDAERLAKVLVGRFGLDLTGVSGEGAEGPFVEFHPGDIHPNEGFVIRVTFGWRSVDAQFVPGPWAASLLTEMGGADPEKLATFSGIAKALTTAGGKIALSVNDVARDPLDQALWPKRWDRMKLSVQYGPLVVDPNDSAAVEQVVVQWGGGLLGLVAALLPLEEVQTGPEPESQSLPEGAKIRVEVNRYERSRLNRALSVAIHGYRCAACEFDFSEAYGELGQDFIHIHHVVPVSKMGADYVPNPATDLVPLCPNCHAMVHRNDPPLSLDDLRGIIRRKKR